MPDHLTPEKRSWNMSRIRCDNTSIEQKARKYLFSKGFRYRKNVRQLPGKPDIVLSKYKAVIFVHGCFWHRHPGCKDTTTPKSRTEYWEEKFARNVANDKKHEDALNEMGWRVFTVWECEINKHLEETMDRIISQLKNESEANH